MTTPSPSALLATVLALAGATACASPELYSWGPYEDSVYALCHDFEDEGLLAEINRLDAHIDALRREDKHPAPGVHAHLGYLEYLAGNSEAAVRHFEAEKAIYPESAVFIDGLLKRI